MNAPFPHHIAFDFPPVRELFLPDPHHTIVDIDLAGADAQVVAWRANDPILKDAFLRREKIHVKNGIDIFGRDKMYATSNSGKSEPYYTRTKKGVHSTNYGATQAAKRCGMTEAAYRDFQKKWFLLHPWIKEWHEKVDFELQKTRTISNTFRYRITFFDRPSACFNRALAWEPQSTVAEVTYRAMRIIHNQFKPTVRLLLQVHDSLVLQIPTRILHATLSRLHDALHNIVVPFDDPLTIPWGLKTSVESWGVCEDLAWSEAINVGAA